VYQTHIQLELLRATVFAVLILVALAGVSTAVGKLRNNRSSLTNAFKNSVMFYNSGNFGLPLIALTFRDSPLLDYAVSVQVMVLMVQNITTNTIGFYNAGCGQGSYKNALKTILRMPVIYALTSALVLKTLPVDVTKFFLWPAFEYMKDGMVPVALLSLGIQLSIATLDVKNTDVYIATFIRLIGGPAIAYLLVNILGIDGVMAQVLFISSAVPSAVNTALIAVEFDNEPDFAAQVVLTTTLLSALTLTGVIYFSEILF
jgi:predicted permease